MSDPIGETLPQDGVMATRPAMAPEAAPKLVPLRSRMNSTASHPRMPAVPDPVVLINAKPAVSLAASAEPALNPYQPNQRSPAPRSTAGRLWGRNGSRFHPMRRPTMMASARPDAPDVISTAVPPAKSSACSLFAIQPP